MYWRCVFGATALLITHSAASAAPEDYCKAYAIDFADAAKRGTPWWQQRFSDAEKACLLQFTFDDPEPESPPVAEAAAEPDPQVEPEPAAEPEPAPVKVAKAKVKRKPKPKVEPVATEPAADDVAAAVVEPTAAPRKKPKLKVGSEAWNDYCTRKYNSFNRKTGTYTSRSGVERRCLVTADFQ